MKVDGIPVEQYELETLRSKIGVVPQKAVLFKGTIRENLMMGAAAGQQVTEADLRLALEIPSLRNLWTTSRRDWRLRSAREERTSRADKSSA